MFHFPFLGILLETGVGKTLIFSSYFQPLKYVITSCMTGAVGFLCILNIPDWKPQRWLYLNSCSQTLFLPDPVCRCSLNTPLWSQPSGTKPSPASPGQWPGPGNSVMDVTFVSGDNDTGSGPPTHSVTFLSCLASPLLFPAFHALRLWITKTWCCSGFQWIKPGLY